ncbi:hypothetical protein HF086_011474 [Spodoptera exigua]|uniref:DUF4806 domain-containing protein n=1 Tax=Spodoptera exigua TaxID=7107 RepID=A0A922SA67_SPOEX|nr:hypothetical protein HF086_011474 [Spodoptera exigua]
MPFTIVQTLEDGKKVLSCVPEGWVKNNCLAWPRKKADKLTRVENSLPGADWFLMPCIVKRSGLTYDEGQLAISIMTEVTDTEEDEITTNIKEEVSKVKSHNDILERCLEKAVMNQPVQQPEPEAPLVVIHTEPSEVADHVTSDQHVQYILLPQQETNMTPSSKSDTTEKLDTLIVTVNAIEKNQKELQENQKQLLLRIISMQAQFEEFLKRTEKQNLEKEIGFNPINSLDSLQKLEDTLKDDMSTTAIIKKLSFVCGTGKGRGLNNCFTLVDVMFDRSFLTTCSWAGGAREVLNSTENFLSEPGPSQKDAAAPEAGDSED